MYDWKNYTDTWLKFLNEWESWLHNISFYYFKPSPVGSIQWNANIGKPLWTHMLCVVFPSLVNYGGNNIQLLIYTAITWRHVVSRWKISSHAFSDPLPVLFTHRRMVKLNAFLHSLLLVFYFSVLYRLQINDWDSENFCYTVLHKTRKSWTLFLYFFLKFLLPIPFRIHTLLDILFYLMGW